MLLYGVKILCFLVGVNLFLEVSLKLVGMMYSVMIVNVIVVVILIEIGRFFV